MRKSVTTMASNTTPAKTIQAVAAMLIGVTWGYMLAMRR